MNRLLSLASELYPDKTASYPRRLHPDIKDLRKELTKFVENKVSKLCEVKSVKATTCSHKYEPDLDFHRGHREDIRVLESETVFLSELETLLHKCIECIKTAYNLCRVKATEVLVFLVANMDRIHKPEIPHAMPIAYALKGYSMKTDVMRCMIEQVLYESYTRGLYIPVIAFDGQWYNIAVGNRNGEPLTLLQLQKDIYNEAKQETKSALLKRLYQANVVHAPDLQTLNDEVKLDYVLDSNSKFKAPILVGKVLNKDVFVPSNSVTNLIKRELLATKSKAEERQIDVDGRDITSPDCILSVLPESVLNALDDQMISEIRRIESGIAHNCNDIQSLSQDALEDLPQLFLGTERNSENSVSPEDISDEPLNIDTNDTGTNISDLDNREPIVSFNEKDYGDMLNSMKESKDGKRWEACDVNQFSNKFISVESIKASFNRKEIQICLRTVKEKLKAQKVTFGLSWPK